MLNRAAKEYGEVGRPAADVDDARAEFLFVVGQYRVTRSKLLENDVVDLESTSLHALDDVLCCALRAGDHVYLGLETNTEHADGFADTLLIVDQEFLRQNVQDLLVRGNRDCACSVNNTIDVAGTHLFVTNRDDAVRVQAAYVATRDAGVDGVNITPRHQFGFFDGALNRMHGRLDIDDDALLEAARRMRPDADHFDHAVFIDLTDNRHDFRRADVQTNDQVLVHAFRHSVAASQRQQFILFCSRIRNRGA